jgi:hypothetical protein
MKRNITVQLDEDVIAKVAVLAAQWGTSISGLVAAEINKLSAQNERSPHRRPHDHEPVRSSGPVR